MRERVITVPKDKNAEKLLGLNEAKKDQLIEIYLSEDEFLWLYQNGFLTLINDITEANIDDFEDDSIIDQENLKKVVQVLTVNRSDRIVRSLVYLLEEAIDRGTGVYFFF